MIYIGLPQWSHPRWGRLGISTLADYARHFNCVEGNTTLYALPKAEIVERWRDQTTDSFRFCFKFPATISHQAALRQCDDLKQEFFSRLAPLSGASVSTGCNCRQRLARRIFLRFGPFSTVCPTRLRMAWKCAIRSFSPKGDAEQALNRGLHQRGVNRVILDSRPVHTAIPTTQEIIDAQRKKTESPGACAGDGEKSDGAVYRQR
ncbi:conserved protein, UPF0759 family [Atlantibacter hermannii]|nr:conserved protein, UPF0759 family [Atlantibacter hermannii]